MFKYLMFGILFFLSMTGKVYAQSLEMPPVPEPKPPFIKILMFKVDIVKDLEERLKDMDALVIDAQEAYQSARDPKPSDDPERNERRASFF